MAKNGATLVKRQVSASAMSVLTHGGRGGNFNSWENNFSRSVSELSAELNLPTAGQKILTRVSNAVNIFGAVYETYQHAVDDDPETDPWETGLSRIPATLAGAVTGIIAAAGIAATRGVVKKADIAFNPLKIKHFYLSHNIDYGKLYIIILLFQRLTTPPKVFGRNADVKHEFSC